jgi:hypothetical protein
MSKLSSLKANENNPRIMSEDSAIALKESMETFGDLSGIVYNRRTNRLVGGHQRTRVITKLIGEDPEIEMIREYDEPNETGTVALGRVGEYGVRFVDWDESKEAMANIEANNPRLMGMYDMNLLPTFLDLSAEFREETGYLGGVPGIMEDFNLNISEDPEEDRGGKSLSQTETVTPFQTRNITLVYEDEEYLEAVGKLENLMERGDLGEDYGEIILNLIRNA